MARRLRNEAVMPTPYGEVVAQLMELARYLRSDNPDIGVAIAIAEKLRDQVIAMAAQADSD
jgi:hypothetical protein